MDHDKIIEATNLSKTYYSKKRKSLIKSERTKVQALNNVSFSVNRGEIFGLLGPNGAGKTTLIKILTTLLLPTSGTARINGFPLNQEREVKMSIGAMLMGERGLYWKLTGRENLKYFGALYHVPKKLYKARIESLIDLLELEDYIDKTVETFSSGMKMKMVFARSLINDAPILMLDEPTNTLDVKEARRLRKIVKEQNESENKTIIYCTHQMYEAEELCHRIAIIDHGRIIALDDPLELKDGLQQSDILSIEGTISEEARLAVKSLPGVTSANILVKRSNNGSTEEKPYLSVVCEDSRQILPEIISTLNTRGAVIRNIDKNETTLEDVFVNITGRSLMDDTRQTIGQTNE
ncbi:MAG: ABC transporter ATP-binding protein [Candidatus Thorarchaeota archaeon]